jgi:hypothetical protein
MDSILEHRFKTGGSEYLFRIVPDTYPGSPREWDSLGIIVYNHPRYILGDVEGTIDDVPEDSITLDVYAYEHGGITLSTSPFSYAWDSGKVGVIYVTKDKIRDNFNVSRVSTKLENKVIDILKSEIKVFDMYLRGEVYGYTLEEVFPCPHCGSEDFLMEDSCFGFYGLKKDNGMLDHIDPKYHEHIEHLLED